MFKSIKNFLFNIDKNNRIESLLNEIDKLECENSKILNINDSLSEVVESKVLREKLLLSKSRNMECVIDFDGINAVSIERLLYTNDDCIPITIIMYNLDTANELKEMMFKCSDKQHNRLVSEFKEYLSCKYRNA